MSRPAARRMPFVDATFLRIETPETPMHVGSLQIFTIPKKAGPNFVQDIVTAFRAPGDLVEPFNLRLTGGPLAQVSPSLRPTAEVDRDYHVRHTALPAPGGERELGDLISHLHGVLLDRSRPLWTCHVIEGLKGGRFAVYTKMHHSVTDGVNGMRLATRSLATSATGAWLAPWLQPATPKGEHRNTGAGAPAKMALYDWPISLGRGVLGLLPGMTRPERVRVPFEAPGSVLNSKVTAARRVATQQLQLARVQEVAHRANVSVNDVFLAICASALRRHMLDAGKLPDRSLIAGVPVSLREPGETGGNAVGFVWATLGTHLVEPRERLNAIHASMRAAKDHLRRMPGPARRLFTTMTMAPAIGVLLSGQAPHLPPPMNVTISNVPGPERPLYLNGARLAGFYPVSVPFQGQALNITCVTYNGQFNIGFTGSRDNLPHLQRLAAYSREALEELEATLAA